MRHVAIALPLLLSTPAMAGTSIAPVHVAPVHMAPINVAPAVHVNPVIHSSPIRATPAVRPIIIKPTVATKPVHVQHHLVQTTIPVAVYAGTQKPTCAPAKPGAKDCAKK